MSVSGGQLRMGFGGAVGLDYGAIIQLAGLQGVTADPLAADLLSDLLPDLERTIVTSLRKED